MSVETRPLDLIAIFADELPVAIWVGRAPSGEIVYSNRACAEILAMAPPPEVLRGSYAEKYGIFDRAGQPYRESEMPFERALAARATVEIDDIVVHRGDGRRAYLRVLAKPLFDAAGDITHVVESFTDITREVMAERARAEGEEQLRHAQRLETVGSLAGGIAHDFNNLLAAIRVLAAFLRNGEQEPRRLRALLDIDEVVDSAVKLTRGLLGFASRGKHLAMRVALDDVVGAIAELLRRTVDRRIEIACELDAAGECVIGDPAQVEQVVMNLVLNARDAMPGAGILTLRTHVLVLDEAAAPLHPLLRPGRHLALEVSDTGTGIDPAIRARIFEPYVTTKTTGPVKGTGLGLATVYGIVRSHGGTVTALDRLPRGTTMRVLLPAAEPGEKPVARPAEPRQVHPGAGLVLVVDDEPAVRGALVQLLGAAGYRVLEAEDGERAVEIYRAHAGEIRVVLLDMIMPRLGGRETFLRLQQLDPEVCVILTTGFALNDEAQAILDLGVRGFLAKPYDIAALSEALARATKGAAPG